MVKKKKKFAFKLYVCTHTQTQTCSFPNLCTQFSNKSTMGIIWKQRVIVKRPSGSRGLGFISQYQQQSLCYNLWFFDTLFSQHFCS